MGFFGSISGFLQQANSKDEIQSGRMGGYPQFHIRIGYVIKILEIVSELSLENILFDNAMISKFLSPVFFTE